METDIMRMQREAEQRVRELREQERRAAHTGEPRGRTAEGLAENRTEWMHASGFQPLSEYKARHMPRQQAAERPKPEPIQEIAKCPPEKRGDGAALSAPPGLFTRKKRCKSGAYHSAAVSSHVNPAAFWPPPDDHTHPDPFRVRFFMCPRSFLVARGPPPRHTGAEKDGYGRCSPWYGKGRIALGRLSVFSTYTDTFSSSPQERPAKSYRQTPRRPLWPTRSRPGRKAGAGSKPKASGTPASSEKRWLPIRGRYSGP